MMRIIGIIVIFTLATACEREPVSRDAEVIEQLRQAGSDLQKPHPVEFFFYFPAQAAAETACKTLESQGFSAVVQPGASPSEFLCQATKPLVPTIDALSRLRSEFESLAAGLGGEYDGWGTPVIE